MVATAPRSCDGRKYRGRVGYLTPGMVVETVDGDDKPLAAGDPRGDPDFADPYNVKGIHRSVEANPPRLFRRRLVLSGGHRVPDDGQYVDRIRAAEDCDEHRRRQNPS